MRRWGAVLLLAGIIFFVVFQGGLLLGYMLSPGVSLFMKVGYGLILLGAVLLLISFIKEGLSKKA